MSRIHAVITAVAVAAALAFSPAFAPQTSLAANSGSGSGSGVKVCKAKTAEGKTKTWRCSKEQACCVNPTLGTYQCGIPGMGCL